MVKLMYEKVTQYCPSSNNASKESTQNQNTPATKTTTTTSVTNAQLKALVEQGIVDALAARDADRNMNGEDNHNSGMGTEGVVELTQWFERMETVEPHDSTFSPCVAYVMTLTELKKKMTDKYCPRGEMKKLEAELWNLKVKGTDVLDYNKCFQELALLCVRMFPEESDKIERYVGGLPDMIHRSVVASKPKTMQDVIVMATELMDKKISTFAERRAENKKKLDNNNQAQQQFPKRQNVAQAYTVGTGERKEYAGTLPLCNSLSFPQRVEQCFHTRFHVTNLKKCYANEPLAVRLDELHIDDKLHFVKEPVEIMNREVKRLKRSCIPLVKVRGNSRRGPEFTWEREDQFKKN
ncbi:putative reverse transcriptase domain-containing protein [Tanacetum coccineum]